MISQIGYPPLRIDILNTIDGVTFEEARENMQLVEVEHDLIIKYIGLNDLIKNKTASGRKQDIADLTTLSLIKNKLKK